MFLEKKGNEMSDEGTTKGEPPDNQPEEKQKRPEKESGYIPSDNVRLIQNLLESQEKKRVFVLVLQGKVNQGEVMIENLGKQISKEADRKRISLKLEMERARQAFEERFQAIDAEEKQALAAARHDVNLVRYRFDQEQKALGQINTQIGRELTKLGVIEVSPASQVEA